MNTRTTSALATLALLALLTPVLQGAGCTAHYSARLQGAVTMDPALAAQHQGQSVVVLYRTLDEARRPCAEGWEDCLADAASWHRLKACDAEEGVGRRPVFVLDGDQAHTFDACTAMVGVYYRADVVAFIDADGDGALDPDERWGGFAAGPVARGPAESTIQITIAPAP